MHEYKNIFTSTRLEYVHNNLLNQKKNQKKNKKKGLAEAKKEKKNWGSDIKAHSRRGQLPVATSLSLLTILGQFPGLGA